MFAKPLWAFLWIAFGTFSTTAHAYENRTWESADGRFTVEATLVRVDSSVVVLRRTDNAKTVSVSIKQLGARDHKYLRNHAGVKVQPESPVKGRKASGKKSGGKQGGGSSPMTSPLSSQSQRSHAAWMEGQWGFRFNMPGMKQPESLAAFDVQRMMDQIKTLDTAAWVQINLTQGANGAFYTSPHDQLAEYVSPQIVPSRDLFGEMLDALNRQGFRVMVYFATEGPTMGKHPDKAPAGVIDNWKKYVESRRMTADQAVAEIIVKEYASRYGTRISGWWFDHAKYGDIPRLKQAVRRGNPDAVVSFNMGGSPKLLTCPESDFTAGHPAPMKRQSPSSPRNEVAITIMENNNYIDGSLGHFFPPMQMTWNSGKPAFETQQAIDWTTRIIRAKGSITWAVALADFKAKQAPLAAFQFDQLKAINEAVKKMRQR